MQCMNVLVVLLRCCWTGENESLIVAGDEERISSYFVEVEVLRDGSPLFREMNSVEEEKLHEFSWGFLRSPAGES